MRKSPRGPGDDLRLRVDRLERLPLRASTAWEILRRPSSENRQDAPKLPASLPHGCQPILFSSDPGWVVNSLRATPLDDLSAVELSPWWQATTQEERAALNRFWINSCAISHAARRFAADQHDCDADFVGHVALIHRLGAWLLAAEAPQRLVEWLVLPDPEERRQWERTLLGEDLGELGHRIAERWGLAPEICEAAWLVDEDASYLALCRQGSATLLLVKRAREWVERTALALFRSRATSIDTDAREGRSWVAEFQSSAERDLFAGGGSPREQWLVRTHARLLGKSRREAHELASARVFIRAMAASRPTDSPVSWIARATEALQSIPALRATEARWLNDPRGMGEVDATYALQAPDEVYQFGSRGKPLAEVRLWRAETTDSPPILTADQADAWSSWATFTNEIQQLRTQVHEVVGAARARLDTAPRHEARAFSDDLAQFAAGAGHELNNPLAVIMGRAQLLLQRTADPEAQRSLRVMIGQCQRAHRMLRDLMYISRPIQPRPRPCQPAELARRCLDDLHDQAEARGLSLRLDSAEQMGLVQTDPEQLRQVVDALTRNAIEASAAGGQVVVRCEQRGEMLIIEVWDQGHGVSPEESRYLFVPFYCGRHAGRGLGLGLPRVAHYVASLGGSLKWSSKAGVGTVFRVNMPAPPEARITAA